MQTAAIAQSKPTKQYGRARTPTVLQMEAVECGAAALGIILAYYKRLVPLTELRVECGVSRDGSKASNVLKAARLYGLNAKGFKRSIEEAQAIKPPFIAFWNFNHFVVIEGFVGKDVYINDPAAGPKKLTFDEFDRAFTGVVLVMEPGEDFKKGGKKKGIGPGLAARLKSSRSALIFCLITGLFLTIPRLAIPAFMQVFIDEILIENRGEWLRPLLIGMAVTALITGLLAQLRLTYLRRLLLKLSITMSGQFLWHTIRLPIGFYAQRFAGEISSRAQLNNKVAMTLSGQLATTVIDSIMMIFYALIMFFYDPLLTAISIAFAAANFVALQAMSRNRVDTNTRLSQETGKVAGVAISGIQTIETVKASGLEADLFAKFAGYYAKTINAQQELGLPTRVLGALPSVLTSLAVTSILVLGGFRVMEGTLSIGRLIAYQSLTQEFLKPVNNLVNFGTTLQELEADLNRLDDVLENPIDPESERAIDVAHSIDDYSEDSFKLQGYVELQNLTFGYNRLGDPLIQDLNLRLNPGQRVALVGGSGSGKSTVAKLITGLYPTWSGEILLDGLQRNQIPRPVLTSSLAMVEQEIFLFAGTVRENLTLWDSTVSEEDLIRACEDAAIHDLILNMPGGYNCQLSEGGQNLSGGQRQRLEIARALVRNPAVLVLDEATSALDAETEQIIDRNLRRRGCSCIVVAHRLSTIRDCDEIIVLSKGKVVQRGTHEELRSSPGAYTRLIGTQTA
ncbi:NHLP family bacteriocin export ABC transporter peptidase/permease/ATPase subunit [Chamaesiphon minutus]|uniref:NHLM bacteriocin system ABC transporter, peptidase/ATP-binding protein n=1 Tax=Chamaesiphon minutus (strain ATCC 27169 / PCC 6605) TaxID=1173020 RepID=K9UIY1_CHAP6|nr:NHLP family bacteriocin export ABC transporter peptidase/permease/ATPase subunit [Chamaesiphon minutus]AFY95072.1 NHLM bacteriocin system ABC transporter, peptidase/ATP-binding protein [Chamaesiphon minutus PCC 6605]